MKISSKTAATTIALFLVLTIAATLATSPLVSAHDPPWTIPTNSYIIAAPNPVGVGQSTLFVVWVDQNPPIAGGNQGPHWDGQIDITKPNGDKQTIGPFELNSATANWWVQYTPDQVGTYTAVFSWPGEVLTADEGIFQTGGIPYINDTFAGSTSEPAYLTVQQEPVAQWQEPPLPTEYWQRPIHDANRGWSELASNWLGGSWLVNSFQRWGPAPESPHILWTQPITPGIAGGINDAAWPGIPTNVDDYERPFGTVIIMDGKIYHNQPNINQEAGGMPGYYCRDLYTGEIIWFKNGTDNGLNNPYVINTGLGSRQAHGTQHYMELDSGWLYHYHSANGQGILAYLIMDLSGYGIEGTNWFILDAYTGNWQLTLKNVPGGSSFTDQDGSLCKLSYDDDTGRLLVWNISQSIAPSAPFGTGQQQWKWRVGATVDAVNDTFWTEMGVLPNLVGDYDESDILPRSGYTMNVTIQAGLQGSPSMVLNENREPKYVFGSSVSQAPDTSGLGTRGLSGNTFDVWMVQLTEHAQPYSPWPDKTNTQNNNLGWGAQLLYAKTLTVPIPNKNYTYSISAPDSVDDPVFIVMNKQTIQKWGYDALTGNLLWGPTEPEATFNYYGQGSNSYYGKILSYGYGGQLVAYDKRTGDKLWTYNATNVGFESPYGENYPLSLAFVADEKVYLYSTEHSPTKPLWRGSYLRCVDINDGTELWKLLDFNIRAGIADGMIVSGNAYDNNIYCIGKGPSATTVTAPDTVQTLGTAVLLKGTVMDTSPGTTKFVNTARFPDGVPAIADADMEAWMEYLYEQQARPANAQGVEVTLDTIDPNNNFVNIGTVTTDSSGKFSYMWTPDIPGKYTVIATFAGSKSYYASYSQTAIGVSEAPAATPPPTEAPASVADLYFVPMSVGIIVAIVVVGLLIVLLLRRR